MRSEPGQMADGSGLPAEPRVDSPTASRPFFAALDRSRRRCLFIAVVTTGATLAVGAGVFLAFGSTRAAVAWWTGKFLAVDASQKNFGVGVVGERKSVTFQITNIGPSAIRLVGFRSGCACTMPERLPIILAAGQSIPFRVNIQLIKEDLDFAMPFAIYTSSITQRELWLHATGRVERAADEQAPSVVVPGEP